ncbi:MAG: hypothetical protein AAGG99_10145, partial [Pseudomonadota bacterium]
MLAERAARQETLWDAVLTEFIVARVASAKGATRADIARDLTSFFSHKLSPAEFRDSIDHVITILLAERTIAYDGGRYEMTVDGAARFATGFGRVDAAADWAELRDQWLTARALGRPDLPATRRKLLAKPDGLRMALVQRAFDLKLRRVPTPARVRAALAGVALKRVMAGELTTDVRIEGGVDAAAGRALAAHLSRRPRPFSSDAQLLAALAAEAIDAPQTDVGTLRLMLLRDYVTARGDDARMAPAPKRAASVPGVSLAAALAAPPNPASTTAFAASPSAPEPNGPVATAPSDTAFGESISRIEAFADRVLAAAEPCAQGFPGSRKAFVAHVFDALHGAHTDSDLALADFKHLLLEA